MNKLSSRERSECFRKHLVLGDKQNEDDAEVKKTKFIRIPLDIQVKIHKIAKQLQKEQITHTKRNKRDRKTEVNELGVGLLRGQAENRSVNREAQKKYSSLAFPRSKFNYTTVEQHSKTTGELSKSDEISKEIDKIIR